MICLIACLLAIYTPKAQNRTFTVKDTLLWKEFGSFLDSAKLETVERFYDVFCIYICNDFYSVTFAFDCNPHWNNGVIFRRNNVDLPYSELSVLKQKIILAMKKRTLKKKISRGETVYKIACY